MSDSTTLEQRKLATDGMEHNMKQITQRQAKLRKEGGFRTLGGKNRGLRRRVDEATWSKRIHLVTAFPHPGIVEDEWGNSFATTRAKPVPIDSSAQAPAPTTITDTLRSYAEEMRTIVEGEPRTIAQATNTLRERMPGLEPALRAASLTATAFIDMFPELLSRRARTISAAEGR